MISLVGALRIDGSGIVGSTAQAPSISSRALRVSHCAAPRPSVGGLRYLTHGCLLSLLPIRSRFIEGIGPSFITGSPLSVSSALRPSAGRRAIRSPECRCSGVERRAEPGWPARSRQEAGEQHGGLPAPGPPCLWRRRLPRTTLNSAWPRRRRRCPQRAAATRKARDRAGDRPDEIS